MSSSRPQEFSLRLTQSPQRPLLRPRNRSSGLGAAARTSMMNSESPLAGMAQHCTSSTTGTSLPRQTRGATASALIATMVLLFAVACNRTKGGPDVMATVNGHKVERAEADKYYNNQIAGAPQKPGEEQAD